MQCSVWRILACRSAPHPLARARGLLIFKIINFQRFLVACLHYLVKKFTIFFNAIFVIAANVADIVVVAVVGLIVFAVVIFRTFVH